MVRSLCSLALVAVQPLLAAASEVSFAKQIAPILQAKCLSCHSAEKAKGGYRIHTFAALFQQGSSKEPALVAGKPEGSELFKRLTSADEDERMPQKDESLSAEQIELFRQWIEGGALLDMGKPDALISTLLPQAPHPAPPEKYRRPLPILALAFAPDGQIAVSGHHEVTFWSMQGELTRRLTNVPQRVRSIAFHPEGTFLALAGGHPGRSGELNVYNLTSGQIETNLVRMGDELLCVAFSADGNSLASAGTDNTIHVFDWAKRERINAIQQHADWVTSICFNTNASQIASVSRDRTARIYDTISGELEVTYTTHNVPLYVVSFLADGDVVSGGTGKALHVWEPKEGKKKGELAGFEAYATAAVLAGNDLFTASADGEIQHHSISDRKLVYTFAKHGDAVYSLAYDPASKTLASGGYDGVINIWNAESRSLIKSFIAAPGWSPAR